MCNIIVPTDAAAAQRLSALSFDIEEEGHGQGDEEDRAQHGAERPGPRGEVEGRVEA